MPILIVLMFSHVSIDARANGEIYANVEATSDKPVSLSINGKKVAYDKTKGCWVYPNPKTWDPEHPNLYTATFTLGEDGHCLTQKIGFRTIEFREYDGIYLNGTKLVVKGTNRHCFNPETGRALSPAMSLQDAKLLKQMNIMDVSVQVFYKTLIRKARIGFQYHQGYLTCRRKVAGSA